MESWNIPKIWDNGDCWIIGGGKSIAEQFNIKSNENDLSKLSPYFREIHNKHVIGVNVAFMFGNWIDVCFFGDDIFYNKQQEKINSFAGLKITCAIEWQNIPNSIKWVKRDSIRSGLSSKNDCLNWNENSGAAAINLAVLLGAKRIFLLGFDMKQVNDSSHFHNVYGNTKPPFERHLKGFRDIAKDAEKLGVKIINCSPDSAIECFEKMTVKEALNI